MTFGIVGWVVVGLLVGFVVNKLVNLRGDDPNLGLAAATAGAIVAGILYTIISGDTLRAWNPWSLMFAAIGAGVAVALWHIIRARSISHDSGTVRRSY